MKDMGSNFEWAKAWQEYPTRCIHLTQNGYECVLHTLESALETNQALIKELMNSKTMSVDRFDQEIERGVRLKLSIQELKRTGDTV